MREIEMTVDAKRAMRTKPKRKLKDHATFSIDINVLDEFRYWCSVNKIQMSGLIELFISTFLESNRKTTDRAADAATEDGESYGKESIGSTGLAAEGREDRSE